MSREDALLETVVGFFDGEEGVVDKAEYHEDAGEGVVMVNATETDSGYGGERTFDLLDLEEDLNDAGFTHTGYVPAPGLTQINIAPQEDE